MYKSTLGWIWFLALCNCWYNLQINGWWLWLICTLLLQSSIPLQCEHILRVSWSSLCLFCTTLASDEYTDVVILLASSYVKNVEHELHIILPHSLQWCCLLVKLKLAAHDGHLVTVLPSNQVTSSWATCLRSVPVDLRNLSNLIINLLVSEVLWSNLSLLTSLKYSMWDLLMPGFCGSDFSRKYLWNVTSDLIASISLSSTFSILLFAFPTKSEISSWLRFMFEIFILKLITF